MKLRQKQLIKKLKAAAKKKTTEDENETKVVDFENLQLLVFDKTKFTKEQAIEWARNHNYRVDQVEETDSEIRLEQKKPDAFEPDSLNTIELAEGVEAVIGTPKEGEKTAENSDDENEENEENKVLGESDAMAMIQGMNEKLELISEALAMLLEQNAMAAKPMGEEEKSKTETEDEEEKATDLEDEENDEKADNPEDEETETKVTRREDETFQQCVQRAVPVLVGEGMPQDQAIASAMSMCELPKSAEDETTDPDDMTDDEVEKELENVLGELEQFES